MKPSFKSLPELRQHYQSETAVTWQAFERNGDGTMAVRRRALLVDHLCEQLWQLLSNSAVRSGVALVANGGFGRKELFPYSDVDILYLCADERAEREFKETIRACNQAMWDIGLRASPATRTVKECDRYDPDNLEFTLSLLDRRFVAGDYAPYQALQSQTLPSPGAAGMEQHCAPDRGAYPHASSKVRRHHLPSRTQHQRVSRRLARLPPRPLAQHAEAYPRT